MAYIPHTTEEIAAMLEAIGVASIDELFTDIPAGLRRDGLDLPEPLSEFEALAEMRSLAASNRGTHDFDSYLGGGAYEHFIPAAVPALALRGEFATAYTPYQAEASQGTLQAIYEFQSMICALTALEVANASLYDGGTALAEGALMAMRCTGRDTLLVPQSLNPRYRATLETATRHVGARFVEAPLDAATGATDAEAAAALAREMGDSLAAVIIPVTNFLGACEPWAALAEAAHAAGGLAVAVANPLSLSVLTAPGDWGADICVGEAQSLGLPLAWGGPYCGYMATRATFMRKMPGRLVGCTTDADGRRGFTLTLQTREQHIRRDKATSNICTNQGLMALQVTIYLALLGREGLRRVGLVNLERAGYLRDRLLELPGVDAATGADFFNEFAVRLPMPAAEAIAEMRGEGILAGLDGGAAGLDPQLLIVCATETKSRAQLDRYAAALRRVVAARSGATAACTN